MKRNKKVGLFPLFAEKSSRCCGPDCDCHKSEKSKVKEDDKKK